MDRLNSHDPYRQRDTLHSLCATLCACVLSAGLIYLIYLVRVVRIAVTTRETNSQGACLLVFGKRLASGLPDFDFQARIHAAYRLLTADPHSHAILLGGGQPGSTEADVAFHQLVNLNPRLVNRLRLEAESENTLENLRNARELMVSTGNRQAVLISNRYHLARCAQFAHQLALEFELHPAENRMTWNAPTALAVLREAFCLCWLDLGTRWARLIGHTRMVKRVT
ncbi:MAG: YdcF family protein [Methylococcaceae bacterium]|nr:YdcF family protein [Methylococcaceae bacterium]